MNRMLKLSNEERKELFNESAMQIGPLASWMPYDTCKNYKIILALY
ncbi:MAG: hypothetical protein ACERKK_08340 [Poseidonibacter sp.]